MQRQAGGCYWQSVGLCSLSYEGAIVKPSSAGVAAVSWPGEVIYVARSGLLTYIRSVDR